jgi:hypothetical protein
MDIVATSIWPYVLGAVVLIALVAWVFKRDKGPRS